LKFKRPTQEVLSKAELVYRQYFSKNLRGGLLLNKEAENILKERGLWDDGSEKELLETHGQIAELEKELESPSLSNEEGKAICDKIRELRLKLVDLNSLVSSVTENTCENVAMEERNYFVAAECVYNSDGAKVFKSTDDFKSKLDTSMALDSYRETLVESLERRVGRDLPSDLSAEYAENKWLSAREEAKEAKDSEAEAEEKPAKTRKKKAKA
jgi:hypothetical protein